MYLASCPSGPEHEFEVVERALELLVELDVTVLGQRVRIVTRGAMQTTGARLDVLHVPPTLATPAVQQAHHYLQGKRCGAQKRFFTHLILDESN